MVWDIQRLLQRERLLREGQVSRATNFIDVLSDLMPECLILHNLTGGPVTWMHRRRPLTIPEWWLQNGKLSWDGPVETIRSWDTHERNCQAILKQTQDQIATFLPKYQDGVTILTVRDEVGHVRDGRGVEKRPKCWRIGILHQPVCMRGSVS